MQETKKRAQPAKAVGKERKNVKIKKERKKKKQY